MARPRVKRIALTKVEIQLAKELMKFGFSKSEASQLAHIEYDMTGIPSVKESTRRIVTKVVHRSVGGQRNPDYAKASQRQFEKSLKRDEENIRIAKEALARAEKHLHTTEVQQKRYAKRRKYTGASAPEPAKQNPPTTMIYSNIEEIRAQKKQGHICDAECKRVNHRYVHKFSSNAAIYGLPNGDVLITGRKR